MARRNKFGLNLHPEVLKKNGRKQFVVLPYEEFVLIQERLEDAQHLLDLRRAVAGDKNEPGLSTNELRDRLGLARNGSRKRKPTASRRRKA
jgi:hypothetical protein